MLVVLQPVPHSVLTVATHPGYVLSRVKLVAGFVTCTAEATPAMMATVAMMALGVYILVGVVVVGGIDL
jgi:hypothetical protein